MYFSHFPTSKFNGVELLDITRRFDLSAVARESALTYMNYTVQEGERPEDVAYYYYDDPSYAWLVLLSNNIIDPYTHWPKSQDEFDKYLIDEYKTKSGRTGQEVIEWTKDRTIGTNIVEYRFKEDPSIITNRSSIVEKPFVLDNVYNSDAYQDTIEANPDVSLFDFRNGWYPVRIFDYEFQLNEARREIQLLNKSLLPQIKEQIETILNDK